MGSMVCQWANVQFPQFGHGRVMPGHDDGLIVPDSNLVSGESDITTSITELTYGQQRLCCLVGHNMAMLGGCRKPCDIYFCFMGGMENGS